MHNNRDAYHLITQSLAPPCLSSSSHICQLSLNGCYVSSAAASDVPKGTSSLICHPEISSKSDIWTAVGVHKVSFLLPIVTAAKLMITFSIIIMIIIFSVRSIFISQVIKILYLMKRGVGGNPHLFAEEDCALVGGKQDVFSLNNRQRSLYLWIHDSENRILKRKPKEFFGGGVRNVCEALPPQSY